MITNKINYIEKINFFCTVTMYEFKNMLNNNTFKIQATQI